MKRVDRDAVRGIALKVNRAYQLFEKVKSAQDAWNERQPYTAIVEQADPHGAKCFIRLRLDEPIPIEWGVVMGEMVHDLRSALDQCVYWLTVARQGKVLESTQFPIFSSRSRFHRRTNAGIGAKGSGLHMIRGLGPGPRAYIESLQPYPQRSGRTNYALAVLHDLWNEDKHRLIRAWSFGVEHVQPHVARTLLIPGRSRIVVTRRAIQHDAIAATVYFDPPRRVQ